MVSKTKIEDNGRVCTHCRVFKEWEYFSLNRIAPNGRKSLCKSCQNKKEKERINKWKKSDPIAWKEARWHKHLKSAYKMSIQDYNNLLKNQNGVCKICKRKPEDCRDKKLFVDHCHTTLKNRGLLCYHCNTVLGMANDSISILENAIEYLKSGQTTIGGQE